MLECRSCWIIRRLTLQPFQFLLLQLYLDLPRSLGPAAHRFTGERNPTEQAHLLCRLIEGQACAEADNRLQECGGIRAGEQPQLLIQGEKARIRSPGRPDTGG